MYYRKRIFIGSSTESLGIASQIKDILSKEYECTIWEEDFFELGKSNYDNLTKNSMAFDYAIFVGGKDDFVAKHGNENNRKLAPRDNVYIEFGLYAGVLSPARTFFVIDNDCTIATDLTGIAVCRYKTANDIFNICGQIQKKLFNEDNISRIKMLPSTSLAMGYYENFIKEAYSVITKMNSVKIGWKKYRVNKLSNKLKIIIPNTVSVDWYSWAKKYYEMNELVRLELNCNLRKMGVMIDYNMLVNENCLCFVDVPLTVKASFGAVDLWYRKDYVGGTDFLNNIKEKEVVNFINTLEYKLAEQLMEDTVSIEIGII